MFEMNFETNINKINYINYMEQQEKEKLQLEKVNVAAEEYLNFFTNSASSTKNACKSFLR